MAFTPNSRAYLLDTPLDNTYKNEILFSSVDSQTSWFAAQKKHEFSGVTYQRKDNIMRVDAHIDDLWDVNYCMYQNTNFGTKWFYAFITKMEYISDRVTDVYLETDVFQTWLFNVTLKPSFVVREHVSDDTIGKHLLEEQLDFGGEYVMEDYHEVGKLGDDMWFIVGVSDNTPMGSTELVGNLYGHTPTGLTYWPFTNNATGITYLKDMIKNYTDAGKIDAIVMIFTVPEIVIESVVNDPAWHFGLPIPSGAFYGFNSFNEPKHLDTLNGYAPKNNKMFTYPYKFLYASNSNGGASTYRYEDFEDAAVMDFATFGSVMPNPKIALAPCNYKGTSLSYEHALILEGFPLGSWTSDMYAAWLAQNGASTAVSLIGGAALLAIGIATGGVGLLAAGGGALSIGQQLIQWHQASVQPDQAKGQAGAGNLRFGDNSLDFFFAHYTIKAEYAKRIDDFLTMFGYKVNTLKVPETHSRQNWNYIQTIDVNIDGAIPANDMLRLKKVYDEGVTLWHTTSGFLNYSLPNNII